MILLAMALAASGDPAADFPSFDPVRTAAICEKKRSEPTWRSIYANNEACVLDQRADYRHFVVVAGANRGMHAVFQRCVSMWSGEGGPDWSMIEYCAVDNVDGKRDVALLRRAAPAVVRPAIDKCLTQDADDDSPGDWSDMAMCVRTQISGHRDFMLFRAAAPDAGARARIDDCRADAVSGEDRVVDWDGALDCVSKDAPRGTIIRADNVVTVT